MGTATAAKAGEKTGGMTIVPLFALGSLIPYLYQSNNRVFAIAFLIVGVTFLRKGLVRLCLPPHGGLLLGIIFVGMLSALLNDTYGSFGPYRVFRDLSYFVAPLCYWLVGDMASDGVESRDQLWTNLFVVSGLSAICVIGSGLMSLAGGISVGTFEPNEFSVMGLVLYLFPPDGWQWKKGHAAPAAMLALACIAAIVLSMSRTTILTMLVFIVLVGFKNLRSIGRFAKFLLPLAVIVLLVFSVLPSEATSSFLDKVTSSFTEVSSSRTVWSSETITNNWRGYETYSGMTEFSHSTDAVKLLGHGFGYLLDVGPLAMLVTKEPGLATLHNGYVTVLLKTGLLGLVFYSLFYVMNLIDSLRSWMHERTYGSGLVLGFFIAMALGTYIINGLFIPAGLYYYTLPAAFILGYSKRASGNN